MSDDAGVLGLVEETLRRHVDPRAVVTRLERVEMGAAERGWTASQVERWRAHLSSGDTRTVIVKTMERKERLAMLRLTGQGHGCVPFAHAQDLATEALAAACMQDVGSRKIGIPTTQDDLPASTEWDGAVARGLAAIHAQNLGRRAQMPWLPDADEAYARDFLVKEVWRGNWEAAMRADPAFAREFDRYTSRLEQAAEQFQRDLAALWAEGDSLTLTHGEIHGEHIHIFDDRPYFIDWGWCYYGPFYLDLPAFFTPSTVGTYRDALAEAGVPVRAADFAERFHAAGRYVGFKYLCSGIWLWGQGPTEETGRRLLLTIRWAVEGTWAERAFNVNSRAWEGLLREHRG